MDRPTHIFFYYEHRQLSKKPDLNIAISPTSLKLSVPRVVQFHLHRPSRTLWREVTRCASSIRSSPERIQICGAVKLHVPSRVWRTDECTIILCGRLYLAQLLVLTTTPRTVRRTLSQPLKICTNQIRLHSPRTVLTMRILLISTSFLDWNQESTPIARSAHIANSKLGKATVLATSLHRHMNILHCDYRRVTRTCTVVQWYDCLDWLWNGATSLPLSNNFNGECGYHTICEYSAYSLKPISLANNLPRPASNRCAQMGRPPAATPRSISREIKN